MNSIIKTLAYMILILPVFCRAQTVIIGDNEFKIRNPQNLSGKVLYEFTYIKDTTQPAHPYKEMYELDFGKTESMFLSYSKKLSDSLMTADVLRQMQTAQDPNHVDLIMRGNAFVSSDMYFTNDSPEVYSLKPLSSSFFYIKDTQPKIAWKIIDSTKKIGNYLCQKAVGESHGRTYIAWFCGDLPYKFGPRKLNSLPGLVLEAYDTKRQIIYTFIRLILPAHGQTGMPENAIHTTDKEYNKAKEAFLKNPAAFRQAYSGSAPRVPGPLDKLDPSKIKSLSVIKETPYGKDIRLKENNPIDLK